MSKNALEYVNEQSWLALGFIVMLQRGREGAKHTKSL